MKAYRLFFFILFSSIISPLFSEIDSSFETSQKTKQTLTVDLVLKGGRVLKLSDGTVWKIAPEDISTSSVWVLSPVIKVQENEDSQTKARYPKKLVNQTTGSSVLAAPQ